jgi:hypothetical protein
MVFSVDQSVTTGLVVVAGFGLLFIGFALFCPSKGLGFQHWVMKALENDFRVMQTKLMPIAWFNPRVAELRHTSVPTNRKRLRA